MMLVILLFNACYAFGLVFLVCELCQRVCDGFAEMNKTMNQFHWQSYPIEIQRLLPIVIIFTQQPIDFEVFGSITCCRESFKKVSSIDRMIYLKCSYQTIYFEFVFRSSIKHSHILW